MAAVVLSDNRYDHSWRLKVYGLELIKRFKQTTLSRKQILNVGFRVYQKYCSELAPEDVAHFIDRLKQKPSVTV